jgi:hypothetical protein
MRKYAEVCEHIGGLMTLVARLDNEPCATVISRNTTGAMRDEAGANDIAHGSKAVNLADILVNISVT